MLTAVILWVATASATPDALVYRENNKTLVITNARVPSCPITHKSAQVVVNADNFIQGCWVLNTTTYMVEVVFPNKVAIRIPATSFKPFFITQK